VQADETDYAAAALTELRAYLSWVSERGARMVAFEPDAPPRDPRVLMPERPCPASFPS